MTGLRVAASKRYFEQSFHESLRAYNDGLEGSFNAATGTSIAIETTKAYEEAPSQVCLSLGAEN